MLAFLCIQIGSSKSRQSAKLRRHDAQDTETNHAATFDSYIIHTFVPAAVAAAITSSVPTLVSKTDTDTPHTYILPI